MVSSLADIGEDAIIHILSFVGTLNDLKRLGQTNKLFRNLVFEVEQVDAVFRSIHPETEEYQRKTIGGRQYWKNLYNLRQLLTETSSRRRNRDANPLQTTGILSPQEEEESLGYDNPTYRTSRPSVGYFGFQPLEGSEGSPVAVWGDFHGLAIVPSLDALTTRTTAAASESNPAEAPPLSAATPTLTGSDSVTKICLDAFQIMAVVYDDRSKLFLGTASGLVQSVLIRKNEMSGSYEFPILSSTALHDNEVTSLACAGSHLISACVDGKVVLHLDALVHGRVDHGIKIFESHRLFFSMASVTTSGTTVLCMGGEERMLEVLFWDADHFTSPENRIDHTSSDWERTDDRRLFRNRRQGHLTNLKFLGRSHPRLVVGTSTGDVAVHDLVVSPRNEEPSTKSVSWRYDLNGCCSGGCVESVQLVETLLLTAGGKDGKVKTWDWETGAHLATIRVHPGRLLGRVTLKCAVVSTYVSHERQSILCMCRDGHIREFSFRPAPATSSAGSGTRKRKDDTAVVPQASRRSTRQRRSKPDSQPLNEHFQFY